MDLLNLMQLGEFRPSVHGLGDFEPNITFVPSKPFLSDGSTYHADTIFAITPVSALAANASRSFHNVQSSSSTVIIYLFDSHGTRSTTKVEYIASMPVDRS
ncbi:hypothetical protein V6Z98_006251 [Aspergillus fumigatus]|jgi:hypothetical protein